MKKYGKSILDIKQRIKLRKEKSIFLTPNEAQQELNRLMNQRIDNINLSLNHTFWLKLSETEVGM